MALLVSSVSEAGDTLGLGHVVAQSLDALLPNGGDKRCRALSGKVIEALSQNPAVAPRCYELVFSSHVTATGRHQHSARIA
jgi:hypothetical protein